MTKWFWTFGVLAAATMATAMAQQPEPREGRDGPPPGGGLEGRQPGGPGGRQPGGPDGPRFRPMPNPVVAALDADSDGVISAEEIKNASAALAKLDKNKDGKLTDDETRPPRPNFGPGGPEGRGPGGPEGRGPEGRGPEGRDPQGRGPGRFEGLRPNGPEGREPEGRGPEGRIRGPGGPEGRGPDGPPPPNHDFFVQHAMEFDADKDGKLSKEELLKFAEDMARRRGPGGPGGEGRAPGGRGPEGRGPGGRPQGEDRPDRPQRPE